MAGAADTIGRNLQAVSARVAAACAAAGRAPADVVVVAVGKKQPAAAVRAAHGCGLRDFGENYLQEAESKAAELADLADCRWHMLGPIQSNKAAAVARLCTWAHAVDRAKTARRLGQARLDAGLEPLRCCVQVNLGAEASKAGIPPAELGDLLAEIAGIEGLEVRGLMCLPEAGLDPVGQRRRFGELRDLLAEHRIAHGQLDTLSMGMSADYAEAVGQGATMIRLGTALFGPRPA